jgi:streptogramin lyase
MKFKSFLPTLFSIPKLVLIVLACHEAHSSSLFRQFSSPRSVGSIVSDAFSSNLWLATSGGVVRFNPSTGEKKIYTDLSDVPDLNLVAAAKDNSGDIWFGGVEGYLTKVHPATEAFTSFNALAATGWSITCMLFFKDNIFIGTPNGLSIFSIQKASIQNVRLFGTFTSVDVTALRSFGDTVALVTTDGIAYCVIGDMQKTILSDPNLWTCVPSSGALGIIHRNDSLKASPYKILETGTTVWQYGNTGTILKNGIPAGSFSSPVSCVLPLNDNSYIAGTENSYFWVYDAAPNTFSQVTLDGPSESNIGGCVLDRSGSLWYVPQDMSNGLGSFNGSTWKNITKDNTPGLGNLVPGQGALGTKNGIIATTRNDIWLSFYSSGLKWFNRDNASWTAFIDSKAPDTALPSPLTRFSSDTTFWWTLISGTCEDSLGYIWVANNGAYNGNILHVRKPRENVWRSFSKNDSSFSSLSTYTGPLAASVDRASGRQYVFMGFWNFNAKEGEGVTVLSYDVNGNPLTDAVTVVNTPKIQQIAVNDIAVANDTLVWIAGFSAIYKMTRNDPTTLTKIEAITSTDPFYAVAAGYDGKAVFCKDRDLYTYSDADQSLTKLTSSGKFGTAVNSIVLDKKNSVYWIASNKGLFRYVSGDSSAAAAGNGAIDVYPNPVSRTKLMSGHAVYFAGLSSANPGIRIFDAGGSLVANLSLKNTKLITWNGTNQAGSVVIPGVYFYQGQAGNGSRCKGKIFVLP